MGLAGTEELAEHLAERTWHGGLRDEVIGAAGARRCHHLRVVVRGDVNDARERAFLTDLAGRLKAVHAWHLQIHDDQIGAELTKLFDRFEPIRRGADDLKATADLQHPRDALERKLGIVNHQCSYLG